MYYTLTMNNVDYYVIDGYFYSNIIDIFDTVSI